MNTLHLLLIFVYCRYYKHRLSITQPTAPSGLEYSNEHPEGSLNNDECNHIKQADKPQRQMVPFKKSKDNTKRFDVPERHRPVLKDTYETLYGRAFDVSMNRFLTMIEDADFSSVYGKRNKANIRHSIYYLSLVMGDEWYSQAAQSVGATKRNCSSANASTGISASLNIHELRKRIRKATK